MSQPTVEMIRQQLDHLEQKNRRLKRAGVAALAVIAAVVLMGQAAASKVVETEAVRRVLRTFIKD